MGTSPGHVRRVVGRPDSAGAFSHDSAAHAHVLWNPHPPSPLLHVTIPGQSDRQDDGLLVHGTALPAGGGCIHAWLAGISDVVRGDRACRSCERLAVRELVARLDGRGGAASPGAQHPGPRRIGSSLLRRLRLALARTHRRGRRPGEVRRHRSGDPRRAALRARAPGRPGGSGLAPGALGDGRPGSAAGRADQPRAVSRAPLHRSDPRKGGLTPRIRAVQRGPTTGGRIGV